MEQDSDILVTGSNSGLGKYCVRHFNGAGLSRQTNFEDIIQRAAVKPYRAIIHCAFNAKPDISSSKLYDFLNDTVLLTQKLIKVPHQKFIFISSADVYPKTTAVHTEDEVINLDEVRNVYGIAKLISESIIQNETANSLILRTTALLGEDARKNSLIKILTQDSIKLTLASQSSFNYILHQDVANFITKSLAENLTGIYNLAASSVVTLGEINQHYQKQVEFGDYHYVSGDISNKKVCQVSPSFDKSSLETIKQFMSTMHDVMPA
ncbi:MAG: NAD-dependent epimerase/dehydratase family protein [Pseudomonadota bacterium]